MLYMIGDAWKMKAQKLRKTCVGGCFYVKADDNKVAVCGPKGASSCLAELGRLAVMRWCRFSSMSLHGHASSQKWSRYLHQEDLRGEGRSESDLPTFHDLILRKKNHTLTISSCSKTFSLSKCYNLGYCVLNSDKIHMLFAFSELIRCDQSTWNEYLIKIHTKRHMDVNSLKMLPPCFQRVYRITTCHILKQC